MSTASTCSRNMSMIGDFVDMSLGRVDTVNRSREPLAESEQRLAERARLGCSRPNPLGRGRAVREAVVRKEIPELQPSPDIVQPGPAGGATTFDDSCVRDLRLRMA